MAAPMENQEVNLGFVEKIEKGDEWKLRSHHFPSKIGGKPAWLSLNNLPHPDTLLCSKCSKPTQFLLQIYCPLPEEDLRADCFHRTIYIFICLNSKCNQKNSNENFKVFRCQLPRKNPFYSYEPPKDGDDTPVKNDDFQKVCEVCGCSAPKTCSKCHSANYCGQTHQVDHWRNGHKLSCGKDGQGNNEKESRLLFLEYELVTEPENIPMEKHEKSDNEKLSEYKDFISSEKSSNLMAGNEKDLEKMALSDETMDKVFKSFKKRISHEPDQVLRYDLGGKPLWVSGDNIPNPDVIKDCQCGAKRQFEFQVMPQLLYHLKIDSLQESIDWGTLAVYTCSNNCNSDSAYHQEFIWKQDFSE